MLELKNINVSFRSERQDKIFGHTRQQVLFDVSLAVKRAPVSAFPQNAETGALFYGK